MSPLFLTETDVDQLLDMPLVIDVMQEAFRQLANGRAQDSPRVRVRAPGAVLHSMSAAAEYLGVLGWKQYITTRAGTKFLVGIYDQQTGDLIALIEADRLGQLRTGAITGLAARWLALPEASEMGLFGSGWQAESQLAAVAAARPLRRALVYSRDPARRAAFADRMTVELQIEVTPVAQPRDAVAGLPIVVTATSSREPVFDGSWLAPGTFVAAVGSNWLQKAEIDAEAVRRADRIVCDSAECCRREAGDLARAADAGVFDWGEAIELADVVADPIDDRFGKQAIVVFKSVGMAIEDVALAAKLIELARQRGLGKTMSF